jgi:aminomethyltransferase
MVQNEAGTLEKLEKLPLDAWHRAQGARMVPFAGYEMPLQYEGIIAEHGWTRSSASLFDASHMGQFRLTGAEMEEALERLVPGDIRGLKRGAMRYTMLLAENGGIIDDLMATRLGDHLFLVVNGATKQGDLAHLRDHLPSTISVGNLERRALLALQGPKAAEVLARLIPACTKLSFMQAAFFGWQGADLLVSRSGYTGEDGFEISVPVEAAEALADALAADERVKPAGLGARDSLRLEAGLPLYGHDLTRETDPVSAGLGFVIGKRRREEGGFPGADRILGLLENGPESCRVGLALEGRMPAREGARVLAGEDEVGTVTSGAFSPTLGRPIAMAFVRRDHARPDTELSVDVRKRRLDARVVPLPFVPHGYYRAGA